jgi:L-fucose isomerase-like protein
MTTPKHTTKPAIGVIFVGRKRPGFDMNWGAAMENRVRSTLAGQPWRIIEPAEKVVDEPTLRTALATFNTEKIEALIVLQCTMGDGRLSQAVAQAWTDPLVIWATPENQSGDMISSCSLVGAHNWGSVFRLLGRPFEMVYGDPDAATTKRQLTEAVNIALTVRRLRNARLGTISGQAPGFFAMAGDTFTTFRGTGAQSHFYSLLEFDAMAKSFSDAEVAADVERFKTLGIPHKDTTDEDLPMASRLYLAMRAFLDTENLDALTVRCWPEMANHFGQWPYVGIVRLLDEGRAVACEGDADGALATLAGFNLGLGPAYITDWLEHDEKTITTWHVGAAPTSLCPPIGKPGGPLFAKHFNIRKPAVIESSLIEDMPITMGRMWRLEGKYYLTAREGRTIKPRRHLMATNSLIEMTSENPLTWFDDLVHEGMPHHPIIFRGHHEALFKRFARAMNMKFI